MSETRGRRVPLRQILRCDSLRHAATPYTVCVRIPAAPGSLWLPVARGWDGTPADPAATGCWRFTATTTGLEIAARFPRRQAARIPAAAPGSRVADLWTYDVAECFFATEAGRYLEVELGAGGHFLVLGFDAPRRRVAEHNELELCVDWSLEDQSWSSRATLPWPLLPEAVSRLNAFAIFGDQCLAFSPLPGAAPDFHQPDHYPCVEIERPL